jgi:hypothetical protein
VKGRQLPLDSGFFGQIMSCFVGDLLVALSVQQSLWGQFLQKTCKAKE